MKKDKYFNVGNQAKIVLDKEVSDLLKVMSSNTWIYKIPDTFVELISNRQDYILQCIRYAPHIYFQLDKEMQTNNRIIKATIQSFQKHNRMKEIDIDFKPLTRKHKQIKESVVK